MSGPGFPRFSPAVRAWFEGSFPGPTEVQLRGWEAIARGAHALLVAPTGSGKTLAAFLAGIDTVLRLDSDAPAGVRIVYVSPLKALVHDVLRNLREPLEGIRVVAERMGTPLRPVRVDLRTGDTSRSERVRQGRAPADILVTTPESLFLILSSRARSSLRTVRTVIVDEVHALAPTKRGTHLALSLERLAEAAGADPQRIGLSATVRPPEEAARFLGGDRPVEIVDASARPFVDLEIVVPVPDMTSPPGPPEEGGSAGRSRPALRRREMGIPGVERGLWPLLHPKLVDAIRANRSTLLFVNSRGLAERLTTRLNEVAGEELVRAHHGSVSRERRAEIEEGLKAGRLRGIVATSSLELGIDMGAVDLVVLVESPGSVARGLQRVGRAGHRVGAVSVGKFFPKFRGDLLECAVVAARMRDGEIESLRVPRNPLDVLAQQVAAICCERSRSVDEIARIVRRSYPYRELTGAALEAVLDLLSGRYPSSEFADLRPLLSWDRSRNVLSPRRSAAMTVRMNAGTIPDRGAFAVHLGEGGPRVGELDEEMVFESKRGDNILLGATTWRIEEITRDRVVVSPAPGEPGRLPFWKGEGLGRPVELGRAIGAFVRAAAEQPPQRVVRWLRSHAPLDPLAAENLAAYLREQVEQAGALPTDRTIVVERFRDELGDGRVCILTPFGARVHAPWALAIQRLLSLRSGVEAQLLWSDDGIALRVADGEGRPELVDLLPDPDEVEDRITEQLGESALFAGLFRENAARALLLSRRAPGRRTPLWAQRLRAQTLLAVARRHPSFPIVLETYRQALSDVFDLDGLRALLRDVRGRAVAVHSVSTPRASPFSRSLVHAWVAGHLYEGDAPSAERRAQALTLDRDLLSELLGRAELRELLDAGALAELEDELQRRSVDRRARDADEALDLLRRLGDLSRDELVLRCEAEPSAWLARLEEEGRAIPLSIAGERRWIAAEDAGLYRDALGAALPATLPVTFLGAVEEPLEALLRRYARHRGPFLSLEPAARYRLPIDRVEALLTAQARSGALARGELRPGGTELDWCDAEVLRRLKRRSLARLRREAAPAEAEAFGRFLPLWQGLGSGGEGPDRLLEAVESLQALPLPWSSLVLHILPARVAGFSLDALDALSASGAIAWVGRGAIGARDGRVELYLRERARFLLEPPDETRDGDTDLHRAILARLSERGASFLYEIEEEMRRSAPRTSSPEVRAALWELVWSGRVSNDTVAPLRALGGGGSRVPGARSRRAAVGGRWSLVRGLVAGGASPEERALARARLLLDRYGIVSREAASAAEVPGGFGAVYGALRAMEDAGQVRRGYFVDGLSGAQFAVPGAVDRLRATRSDAGPLVPAPSDDVLAIETIDPANPYGVLLPWPEAGDRSDARLRRTQGAWVVLARGKPALWVGPRMRRIATFPATLVQEPGALDGVLRALRRLPRGSSRGKLVIESIDGIPARESPLAAALRAIGFGGDGTALVALRY